MSAPVRRHHVVNLITGNPHPFAVHFDFIMVAGHTALGRATIHQVAARTLAVIPSKLRVEVQMPCLVAVPVTSFLCRCVWTDEDGEHASEDRPNERMPVLSTNQHPMASLYIP